MKIKEHVPNMLTLLNLTLGMLAIISVLKIEYSDAAMLILLAAFTDRLDGNFARKFDVVSEVGKQLDSICDFASFGVAPAVLVWSFKLEDFGTSGMMVAIIFTISGAYRLAKYNVVEFDGAYVGMPITIAGGIVALMALYGINYSLNTYVAIIIMLVLSYVMNSKKVRIKKI
ncbi:MAG: CDP-diacylglycerol--serine O-phosphatidyltransferase [Alkaliphilus sp.]